MKSIKELRNVVAARCVGAKNAQFFNSGSIFQIPIMLFHGLDSYSFFLKRLQLEIVTMILMHMMRMMTMRIGILAVVLMVWLVYQL